MNPVKLFEEEISQHAISSYTQDIISRVRNGYTDPLKALTALNAIKTICDNARKEIMEDAIEEFDKYGEKEVGVMGGAVLSKKETGVRYDFSNNEKWNEIKAREDEVARERKGLEAKLRTFTKPGMISIDDEMIEVMPPVRKSITTIAVSIK